METLTIRDRVIEEIKLIPAHKLSEIYDVIYHFRLGLASRKDAGQILEFAGCWNNLPEAVFNEFLADVARRRQQAFSRRRSDETRIG